MAEALSLDQVTEAFEGRIKPVRKSPFYVLGLFIVTLIVVLLPMTYVALMVLAGYGVYYHATENLSLVTEGGLGYRIGMIVYVTPLVIGPILVLFMAKPLFARYPRSDRRMSLVPHNEPVLFAFVEQLCKTIGAPKPKRIDINCEINAGAGFRRGLLSLFWPGDLVLTIGVPFVAALSLRQFSGILSHEFGHFAQGTGMRLSYIISYVIHWFARAVYERDTWDEWLVDTSESEEGAIALIFLLARIPIWMTRCILWILMHLAHIISCGMSRQMEYDADRYEVRVAGSQSFESTEIHMHLLDVASDAVHRDLKEAWRDGKLADNYPSLVAAKIDEMPREVKEAVVDEVKKSKTGLWSTHPAASVRIRRARKQEDTGVLRIDGPASALFSGFTGLCKAVTLSYYQDLIGPAVTQANLISTAALDKRRALARQDREAADRFFLGCLTIVRPLQIDRFSDTTKLTPKECAAQLKRSRTALEKHLPVVRSTFERHRKADDTMVKAQSLHNLLKSGIRVDPKVTGLEARTAEEMLRTFNKAQSEARNTATDLAKIETVMRMRMESSIALLDVDQVAERVKGATELRKRCDQLLEALVHVHSVAGVLTSLRREQPSLIVMAETLPDDGEVDDDLRREILRVMSSQQRSLAELRRILADEDYPFEHASGKVSMAKYALRQAPASNDLGETIYAVEDAIGNMNSLYHRTMGELSRTAEKVERVLGLKPLKMPPKPPTTASENK